MKELILKYELHPDLWDVTRVEYRDRIKKQNIYKEISEEMNINENELCKKIHNLRTQFHQEFRRIRKYH